MNFAPHDKYADAVKRCVHGFVVLLSLSALTEAQVSQDQSEAIEVKTAEEAFRRAQLKYDTALADTILADEFIGTWNHEEKLDKKHFLSLIGDKNDPLEVLEYGEMKIQVYGATAVVWSTIHEKAKYGGDVDEYRGRRTAIWVKRGRHWRCVTIRTSAFEPKTLENK